MSSSKCTAEWKAKNPEKVKEAKAKWYQKHKAEIARKAAERNLTRPEPKRTYNAKWRAENKDHKKAYNAAYELNNPESSAVRKINRRAREAAAEGKLSSRIKVKLFALQRGKCACCKQPLGDDYHLDHIMPLALGGSNTDDNVQLLRKECNLQKSAKHPTDFMQLRGYLI